MLINSGKYITTEEKTIYIVQQHQEVSILDLFVSNSNPFHLDVHFHIYNSSNQLKSSFSYFLAPRESKSAISKLFLEPSDKLTAFTSTGSCSIIFSALIEEVSNMNNMPTDWKFLGLYDETIQYHLNNIVSFNNDLYIVINELPKGTEPSDMLYWKLFLQSTRPIGVFDLDNYFQIEDRKVPGSHSGTFTESAWRKRDLNTIVYNSIEGADLLQDNTIILPAGKYFCDISVPAYNVNHHIARLYNNTTNPREITQGTSAYSPVLYQGFSYSLMKTPFILSETSNIEIQHICMKSMENAGFGAYGNMGQSYELQTVASFWRI